MSLLGSAELPAAGQARFGNAQILRFFRIFVRVLDEYLTPGVEIR
jgi:hypothetical protein